MTCPLVHFITLARRERDVCPIRKRKHFLPICWSVLCHLLGQLSKPETRGGIFCYKKCFQKSMTALRSWFKIAFGIQICDEKSTPSLHFEPLKLMNCAFNSDSDPAFRSNADPDPASKNYADPCRSGFETLDEAWEKNQYLYLLVAVLRNADPGCLSRILDTDFYPSLTPDPNTAVKERGEKKFVVIPFFVVTNFTKM